MKNKNNFLAYINNPMSKEGIAVLYGANNIKFERCELYSDFVQSLLRLAFDTYMGDKLTNQVEQLNHFSWCWKKNAENFAREGVHIDSKRLYIYFLEFMIETYYISIDKKDETNKSVLKLWYNLFDYTKLKTHSDMDTFIEIYLIFEKSRIKG